MTLQAIMRNPALKRTLTEAYNAPIWSTKRTKAQNIIKTFWTLMKNKYDWQGGPANISPTFFSAPTQSQPAGNNSYNNVRIFPWSPTPNSSNNVRRYEDKMDWQWGPLTIWNNISSINQIAGWTTNPLSSLSQNSINQTPNYIWSSSIINPSAKVSLWQLQKWWADYSKWKALSNLQIWSWSNDALKSNINTLFKNWVLDKNAASNLVNSIKNPGQLNKNTVTPTAGTVKQWPAAPKAPTTVKKPNVWAPSTGNVTPSWNTTNAAPQPYANNDVLQAQWDALTPGEKNQYKSVYDAVNSGVWANTFFYGAMANKETLKKLFPWVKDADLPTGASLSWQLQDLSNTLKKEYNLDTLLNQKTQLWSEQNDFKQDVTDYISGRDEYLSGINKMIDNAQNQSLTTDDPYAARNLNNYVSYLYVLKGRQNKNYVDYLNSAVTNNNQTVANAETAYQNAVNNYNTDFASQKDITTEQYTTWKDILTDMYNKLDQAKDKQLDTQYKQAQIDQVKAGIAVDTLNAQVNAKNAETNAKNADTNAAEVQAKNSAPTDWLAQEGEYEKYLLSQDTKTKDQLLPGADLAGTMIRAESAWLNSQGVIDTFQRWARQSINAASWDANSITSAVQNAADILKAFNNNTQWQYKDQTAAIAKSIGSTTANWLSSYIDANADNFASAINDLWKKHNTNAADFANSHPKLNYTVATQLFNYYKSNPEYWNTPQMLFSWSSAKIKSSQIPQLKNTIANAISSAWWSSLINDTSISQ